MGILFTDEDVYFNLVTELRARGLDVVTVKDLGLDNAGLDDTRVLAAAHERGRILLTFNRRDYIFLHNGGNPHSGIIVCKRNASVEFLVGKVDSLLRSGDEFAGKLFRIIQ